MPRETSGRANTAYLQRYSQTFAKITYMYATNHHCTETSASGRSPDFKLLPRDYGLLLEDKLNDPIPQVGLILELVI